MVDQHVTAEWRVPQGYPDYEVSEFGQVRRIYANPRRPHSEPARHIIKSSITNKYPSVHVYGKKILIHRLVCIAFHGLPPTPMHEVAHADGDKLNPSKDNLRWATRKENHSDKWTHGTQQIGSRNPFSKLNEDDVRKIRLMRGSGMQGKTLAELFKVTQTCICDIHHRRNWRHV